MIDERLHPELAKYSDQVLMHELQIRKQILEEERCKTTKCCYCGKFLSDKEECYNNPFSGYHVG
jgi:hypothetical protein